MASKHKISEYLKLLGFRERDVNAFYPKHNAAEAKKAGKNEILVYGPIVDESTRKLIAEWFGDETLCSGAQFKSQLDKIDDDDPVVVRINSPGGDIYEASVMNAALADHGGEITVRIDGLCASAATFLLRNSAKVVAAELCEVMIHNAWGGCIGNKKDMDRMSSWLDKSDKQIAEFYARRMDKPMDEIEAMMNDETLFTAKEAVEIGLADELLADDERKSDKKPSGKQNSVDADEIPEDVKKIYEARARAQAQLTEQIAAATAA